jgi:membrane-associated protease RseP (regulator of RpoE activity)
MLFVLMYGLAVIVLKKKHVIEKYNMSWFGPFIMLRTTKGLFVFDKLAKPKKAWKALGNLGTILLFLGMIGIVYFMFISVKGFLTTIDINGMPEPDKFIAPRNIFLIPGVNEFLPAIWGWIAFVLSVGLHELGHAVMSRVEKVKVNSMGILLAIFPVGGFAEPDNEEIIKVEKKSRVRILVAGVTMNFLLAFVCFSLLFGPVLGAIEPVGETIITGIDENGPAISAGIQNDTIIVGVNGNDVNTIRDFVKYTDRTKPGDTITITGIKDGVQKEYTISTKSTYPDVFKGVEIQAIVTDSPAEKAGLVYGMFITSIDNIKIENPGQFIDFMDTTTPGQTVLVTAVYPENNTVISKTCTLVEKKDESDQNLENGYIGIYYNFLSGTSSTHLMGLNVSTFQAGSYISTLKSIPSMLTTKYGWFLLLALPIYGIDGEGFSGFSGAFQQFFHVTSWAEPFGVLVFWLANALLWTGWLSFYVGLFNCLPAKPLDGGHVAEEYVQFICTRITKDSIKSEIIARKVLFVLSTLFIGTMLFMVAGPYMVHGF